jgi:hypothetical protein
MDTAFADIVISARKRMAAPKVPFTTVTQLDAQQAPAQRSTKTHGRSGHWKPGVKHHYWTRGTVTNPIK